METNLNVLLLYYILPSELLKDFKILVVVVYLGTTYQKWEFLHDHVWNWYLHNVDLMNHLLEIEQQCLDGIWVINGVAEWNSMMRLQIGILEIGVHYLWIYTPPPPTPELVRSLLVTILTLVVFWRYCDYDALLTAQLSILSRSEHSKQILNAEATKNGFFIMTFCFPFTIQFLL